ncbi:hypothetical protein ACFLT9_09280 [Acidobacteriota bacterium]
MKRTSYVLIIICLILIPVDSSGNTVFIGTKDNQVLVGCNEDFTLPLAKFTFIPPAEGKYGVVYFGFEQAWQQGGLNDQGLYFNWAITSQIELSVSSDKELFQGNIIEKIMQECASVEEAQAILYKYHHRIFERAQLFIADKTGQSIIYEGDAIQRKFETYQIMTNFRQSRVKPGDPRDVRFLLTEQLLIRYPVTVGHFRNILSSAHQEFPAPTQYSMILDLNQGLIYVYLFHNYENQLLLTLSDEFKKGNHEYNLENLFPQSFSYTQYKNLWLERARAQTKKK